MYRKKWIYEVYINELSDYDNSEQGSMVLIVETCDSQLAIQFF